MARTAAILLACLLFALPSARAHAQPPKTHARLQFKGDLDATRTGRAFIDSIRSLEKAQPDLILIELSGNRARSDILFDLLRELREIRTPLAVYLQGDSIRRVGPGQLAIALAAGHAAIAPGTRIVRTIDDDLGHLNPDIADWLVVGLDLRRSARDIAEARGLPRHVVESLMAPRSDYWIDEDDSARAVLTGDPSSRARAVVERSREGWTFTLDTDDASRLFGLPVHRNVRIMERALSIRGRPVGTAEVEGGLGSAHARCLSLVDGVRASIGRAELVLDVRGNRRGSEVIMPRDYHTAADRAAAIVAECRAAIAEIERHSTEYPELLWMTPPADARTPTEIGGPTRTPLAAWRAAIRDAERDLARLDDRIAEHRRR